MSTESYSVSAPAATGWMSKRFFGIPAVYLAGAVVVILVLVAYLGSKKNTTGATATTATDVTPVDPYQTLNSTGTVTTSQPVYYVAPNTQNVDIVAVETNATWQKKVVEYLVSTGSTVAEAQGAVQAYITGQDMTFAEGALINMAVLKYGTPPAITNIGKVTPKPVIWTDPTIYKSYQRDPATGAIYGLMEDGTQHHITMPEWLALQQNSPTHLMYA